MVDYKARLTEILALQDGWHNGSGKAFNKVFINHVDTLIVEMMDRGAPAPYIYPFDDSLNLEWDIPDCIMSIHVDGFITIDIYHEPDAPLVYEGDWGKPSFLNFVGRYIGKRMI